MVVYRDESVANGTAIKDEDLLDVIDVELTKKPGKGLGLSIVGRKNGNGIFISDIVITHCFLSNLTSISLLLYRISKILGSRRSG